MCLNAILSLNEVFLSQYKTHLPLVSILSPYYSFQDVEVERKLARFKIRHDMRFDDVSGLMFVQRAIYPTTSEIEACLKWSEDKDDIVLHCHAGISRSTTMGYGILLHRGYDPLKAACIIKELRPRALFNAYMLGLISDVVGVKFETMTRAYLDIWKEEDEPDD